MSAVPSKGKLREHDMDFSLLDESLRALSLLYWIVTPTPDDEATYTPFQGFGVEIANGGFCTLLEMFGALPWTAGEIFQDREALPSLRQFPFSRTAAIVGTKFFGEMQQELKEVPGIHVIVALPENIEVIKSYLQISSYIFVSLESSEGVIGIYNYAGHPAQLLDQAIHDVLIRSDIDQLRNVVASRKIRSKFEPGTRVSRGAGVTLPNEMLSASLGEYFTKVENIDLTKDEAYVDAINDSARHVIKQIDGFSSSMIVYAPSITRHLYAFGSAWWNKIFRRISSEDMRRMVRDGIIKNRGYSGAKVRLMATNH